MMKENGLTWLNGMIKNNKYWIIFVGVVIILIFVWAIFIRKPKPTEQDIYEKKIEMLQDSINSLNRRILAGKETIDSLKVEITKVQGTIIYIEKQGEKVDNWLVYAGTDANLRFLSDYLSGENDFSER